MLSPVLSLPRPSDLFTEQLLCFCRWCSNLCVRPPKESLVTRGQKYEFLKYSGEYQRIPFRICGVPQNSYSYPPNTLAIREYDLSKWRPRKNFQLVQIKWTYFKPLQSSYHCFSDKSTLAQPSKNCPRKHRNWLLRVFGYLGRLVEVQFIMGFASGKNQ